MRPSAFLSSTPSTLSAFLNVAPGTPLPSTGGVHGTARTWRDVVESYQVDILSPAVLGDLEEVDHTLEP